MFFAAALAVAAASASMVFAQDVSFNPASLNQVSKFFPVVLYFVCLKLTYPL